ncbi:hypothetical protein F4678DRAFT_484023 [Xylaria arbuscula]|nr:hypothetical protein F4678DRAFT_484023 [Xylaria arbuscula]
MSKHYNEPIAIVGSACRLPGDVSSPSQLWDLLSQPRDTLSEIPADRFNVKKFHHADAAHHGTTNGMELILEPSSHFRVPPAFDAQFFGVKPGEADAMDPQQRLLLETTYDALTSSGHPVEEIRGTKTGVFVGLMSSDYADAVGRDIDNVPTYFAPGISRSIVSNRISYTFDLHGPSMTIDTACSSSLVALHQAVLSLRNGDSCAALVAGSNLLLSPDQYVTSSKLQMLSSSGRCRMWDKDADGYGRGEGVIVLVLKPLSAALANKDSIECIIRETGVNQDGRTKGITEPNPLAQADLIRDTYAKAGLDLSKQSDRPQFFEAHGTGTPAGDPTEAQAINTAFFESVVPKDFPQPPKLLVGSIKTVLGHSEGTAGVAGILKACLALQHGIIPPNLHFNKLSPRVQPFYSNLEIPQEARKWPRVTQGSPRRISVNSFGFGGTNAHAILESFDVESYVPQFAASMPLVPFNFSAATENSLIEYLRSYSSYLKRTPFVNLRNLAWTLNTRRTVLPVRVSVLASTTDELISNLEHACEDSDRKTLHGSSGNIHSAKQHKKARILGIFTGQGAQWASMGSRLLRTSSIFRECFDVLQRSLDTLPQHHAPSWSLTDELLRPINTTQIQQAAFSQPLCTAVQIALIDMLVAAGISFTAVIGHSSGEIAAAYAAGYLSAEDAIRVSYYRGLILRNPDADGQNPAVRGAMLAAGCTYKDAQDLCKLPSLQGRVHIAAHNSPTSVTLSGEVDSIQIVKEILEDENKFTRLLRVDQAYHSPYMASHSRAYESMLEACCVQWKQPRLQTRSLPSWISSVTGDSIENIDFRHSASIYWNENMTKPVLFSQAVESALGSHSPFDLVLEVGPHPALKAPALETIKAVFGNPIPYIGTLHRESNDVEAFGKMLGTLWKLFGPGTVDFASFDKAVSRQDGDPARLLKDLPVYPWNHDRIFWHKSRSCEIMRMGEGNRNQLLGNLTADSSKCERRFKHRLTQQDIPWLSHHQIQGELVFPASGYISSLIEAVTYLFSPHAIRLIEFSNVVFGKALIIPRGTNTGIDTILSIRILAENSNNTHAIFTFSSGADTDLKPLTENMSGVLLIHRGPTSTSPLPPPCTPDRKSYLTVEADYFYSAIHELGHGYHETFRGLSDLHRKSNEATGMIGVPEQTGEDTLIMHPAVLDCAIQALLLAYCYPGDGRLRCLHLPTKMERLCIDLSAMRNISFEAPSAQFHSSVTSLSVDRPNKADIIGDVDIWDSNENRIAIQLQGLHATPLYTPSAENDATIFFETNWELQSPTQKAVPWEENDKFSVEHSLSLLTERVSYFYLRKLATDFPPDQRGGLQPHHVSLLDYADHALSWVASGTHPYVDMQCNLDTEVAVHEIIRKYPISIDMKAIQTIGEGLFQVLCGEKILLETMMADNLLNEYYSHSVGMAEYLEEMGRYVKQLCRRFPHMRILEIGAGVGAATERVLMAIGHTFLSYTYTDLSSNFFQNAQRKFADFMNRMMFKVLDIEKAVSSQGFTESSYDLIIGSLVLHATSNLKQTLVQIRKLLRPGGYLIILEVTNNDALRPGLLFGGLPGWWLGANDGRRLSPCVTAATWETLFTETGFSSIDAITPDSVKFALPLSVIVCQALDERIQLLRNPFARDGPPLQLSSLTVIGENPCLSNIHQLVASRYHKIDFIRSLDSHALLRLPDGGTVISLLGSHSNEASPWKSLVTTELMVLQEIFKRSKIILFVTQESRYGPPYESILRGLQRTISLEMPDVLLQSLHFEAAEKVSAELIVGSIIQLELCHTLKENHTLHDILWSLEPELLVRRGQIFIPRIFPNHAMNQRYNSTRRPMTNLVKPDTGVLSVVMQSSGSQLVLKPMLATEPSSNLMTVRLTYSILSGVSITPSVAVYLSLGNDTETGRGVVILSSSLESPVRVPPECIVELPMNQAKPLSMLESIYNHILAQKIMSFVARGSLLAVLNPPYALGELLIEIAKQRGVPLYLLTTNFSKSHASPWIFVHERATKKQIRQILPPEISCLVNMGSSSNTLPAIESCVPYNCRIYDHSTIDPRIIVDDGHSKYVKDIAQCLQSAWASYTQFKTAAVGDEPMQLLRLGEISNHSLPFTYDQPSILTWDNSERIAVSVQPTSSQLTLSPDRTYWLVGLTGGLGRSLCQWMTEHGARYFAMSSRNPQLEESWLQSMAADGYTIRVFSTDITDRQSVRHTHDIIMETLPPIAGVAQGAMVLHDTPFLDISAERFKKVLKPKVDGTIHLAELFSTDTLDFFVCFSSLAYIVGNRGQSAYTSANAFMTSLMAQRRVSGLAGSVIHIGAILGEGYLTRQLTRERQMILKKSGFSFLSEHAFHELFAEGVLASRPGLGQTFHNDGEIVAGLRVDDDNSNAAFSNNPVFQHIVKGHGNVLSERGGDKRGDVSGHSIKRRLEKAVTKEEILGVIEDGFLAKLSSSLQMIIDDKAATTKSPDELGIDSLVAVDIQSWFRKELGIDLATMSILNAPSFHHLLQDVVAMLPISEAPNAKNAGSGLVKWDGSEDGVEFHDTVDTTATPSLSSILPSSSPSSLPSDFETETPSATLKASPSVDMKPSATSSKQKLQIQSIVPMSYSQLRFWFLSNTLEDRTAFNITTLLHLRGPIDISKLSSAVRKVGCKHEALRTAFYMDESTRSPVQAVLNTASLHLETHTANNKNQVDDVVGQIQSHVFNLEVGEIVRLAIVSLPDNIYYIVFAYHHIALDGIGHGIFLSELENAYNERLEIEDDMRQYTDLTLGEIQDHKQGAWAPVLRFWRGQFANLPSPLPLLTLSDRLIRPSRIGFKSYSVKQELSRDLKSHIHQISKSFNASPYNFYLTTFGVLLSRYADPYPDEICIGLADSGRKDANALRSLGLFLNLVPLRFTFDAHRSFADTLKSTKIASNDAHMNARVPFNALLDELKVSRSPSYHPLFQAFFNYRPNIRDTRSYCGCEATGESISTGQQPYDISIDILDRVERENTIELVVNSDLYTERDARVFLLSYVSLLQSFSHNPAIRVGRPAIHLGADVRQAITQGQGPQASSNWQATLVHRIDNIVEKYQDRPALTNGANYALTYSQMAQRINQIALLLVHQAESGGFQKDSCIGVFQAPGPDWICSFLAVLRVGASCIPLEQKVGNDRLAVMVKSSRPRLILVDNTTIDENDLFERIGSRIIDISCLAEIQGDLRGESKVSNNAIPQDTALIMYTSGSTGIPKGIRLSHLSFRNYVENWAPRWGFVEGQETVLQQSSVAFDMSISQILICLSYGGTLVIPEIKKRWDPVAICQLIVSKQVTFTFATPTEYFSWIRCHASTSLSASAWRGAVSGGEPITRSLVQAFDLLGKSNLELINVYGPTEATFGCADSLVPLSSTTEQSIQRYGLTPMPNYSIYILDQNLEPVPVGVSGRVAIGGAGVALGYLNQKEQSSDTFLIDKQASQFFLEQGWSTVHLTEDRGRFDANGHLILEGRLQESTLVKIGGIRVDLQDIESSIIDTMAPSVLQAVVSYRDNLPHETPYLVAFVILRKGAGSTDSSERDLLSALPRMLPLPQYMQPSIVVAVDAFPKTISQKFDRRAIQALPLSNIQRQQHVSNELDNTTLAVSLRNLWLEILPPGGPLSILHEEMNIDGNTDFFHVGGNSLSLINLQEMIKSRLGSVIPIYLLFEASSFEQMTALLHNFQQGTEEEHTVDTGTSIDWMHEVTTLSDINKLSENIGLYDPPAPIKIQSRIYPFAVVLTGSTGFLGKVVLQKLVGDNRISQVHCLAVRRPKDQLSPSELYSHSKVTVYSGDLSQKCLGLDAATARSIFNRATVVLHVGSDVSFLKPYRSLRPTNVESTKDLVELSIPRHLPIHYISTASISQLLGEVPFSSHPVNVHHPPIDEAISGYLATKWVSEAYLEYVNSITGLPVTIHRPSSITGQDAPDLDLMANLIKYARLTKTVPDTSSWEGSFNFISVETTAQMIVDEIMKPEELDIDTDAGRSNSRVRYVCESDELEVAMTDFKEHLSCVIGEPLTALPMEEWIEVITKAGLHPLLSAYLRRVAEGQIAFPSFTIK